MILMTTGIRRKQKRGGKFFGLVYKLVAGVPIAAGGLAVADIPDFVAVTAIAGVLPVAVSLQLLAFLL